jgi:hypothetical protein
MPIRITNRRQHFSSCSKFPAIISSSSMLLKSQCDFFAFHVRNGKQMEQSVLLCGNESDFQAQMAEQSTSRDRLELVTSI